MARPKTAGSMLVRAPARARPIPRDLAVPAIVLGRGVTALGVLRALGRRGVHCLAACPPGDIATKSRWCRPLPGVPAAEEGPEALANFLDRTPLRSAVLFPCDDARSSVLAALPPDVRERFRVVAAPQAVLPLLIDKWSFAETARRFGTPHPRTVLLSGEKDLEALADADLPGYFIKPRDSQRFGDRYHVKAFHLRDRAHAADLLRQIAKQGIEGVLQEYVPGPPTAHHFLDGYVDREGRLRALFARRRLRMHPSDFGNSTAMVSVRIEEVAPAAKALLPLLRGIGYRGIFSAEFKLDPRDGLHKILEINARPWWYVEFAALCGVDVCWLAYLDALGLPLPPLAEYAVGKRFLHLANDVRAFLEMRRAGGLGLAGWLRSIFGASGTFLRRDDPRPGLSLLARKLIPRLSR